MFMRRVYGKRALNGIIVKDTLLCKGNYRHCVHLISIKLFSPCVSQEKL